MDKLSGAPLFDTKIDLIAALAGYRSSALVFREKISMLAPVGYLAGALIYIVHAISCTKKSCG